MCLTIWARIFCVYNSCKGTFWLDKFAYSLFVIPPSELDVTTLTWYWSLSFLFIWVLLFGAYFGQKKREPKRQLHVQSQQLIYIKKLSNMFKLNNKDTSLRSATLFKKGFWQKCFPVNFAKFLITLFLKEHHLQKSYEVTCKTNIRCVHLDSFYNLSEFLLPY